MSVSYGFKNIVANKSHIPELLNLYYAVYGSDYPISIGYDFKVMEYAITHPEEYLWMVALAQTQSRDGVNSSEKVVGSTVFQLYNSYGVGKVIAVAVLPEYRGNHISTRLITEGTKIIFEQRKNIHALYTTTRTLSAASQLMFLSNGYYPLGIFPNAHKIKQFETLTFMGSFRSDVLEKREYVQVASDKLKPILKISNKIFGKKSVSPLKKVPVPMEQADLKEFSKEGMFEFIFAPNFVKKFYQQNKDKYCCGSSVVSRSSGRIVSPFETPNLLIVAPQIDLELFAYFSPKDHYCVLVSCNKKLEYFGPHLKQLIFQMKDHGVSYVETLISLDCDGTIEYLLQNQFLPSAICTAFQERDGKFYDHIFLSRTMEPLDFSNMQIDRSFKPFIDQYIDLWTEMLSSSVKVLNSSATPRAIASNISSINIR
ncbi:MAG: GNAT family N-acetyltransferase [Oligoflexia bacterium]|nr:GNAT family N-acetyltransferase [Oligoflexia bacterium]